MSVQFVNGLGTSAAADTGQSAGTSGTAFSKVLSSAYGASETNLDRIFEEAAQLYQVPENLLKAVAKAESNFNANATSSCGAMGVMQLMPATAQSLGVEDAYDAGQNIMGGAKYLGRLLEQYDGDAQLALAAYNAGPGNVAKYGGIPPFAETQAYVEKVMGYYGSELSAAGTASAGTGQSGGVLLSSSAAQSAESGEAWKDAATLLLYAVQMQLEQEDDDQRKIVG